MRLRAARLGVLIACVMGLMVTMTPAEATWVKTVTFTGTASLFNCPGVGSPGVTGEVPETKEEVKSDPKGVPEVHTTVLNGNTCDFRLLTTACVKTSVGKKTGVDPCNILATGTVTGFCGLSSGKGTAVLTNLSGTKADVVTDFLFSSTASTLRVSGGTPKQWIKGVVNVAPTAGSCTNKTATGFLVSGDVEIKKITNA